jgi:hypothetical protein
VTVEDEVFVATLQPNRNLRLLDLTEVLEEEATEFESLDIAIHMLFLACDHCYPITRQIAEAALSTGFDGLIYPSYFSLLRTGGAPIDTVYGISIRRIPQFSEFVKEQMIPNLAIFGRPIDAGTIRVRCIDRVILSRAEYSLSFGPVGYK